MSSGLATVKKTSLQPVQPCVATTKAGTPCKRNAQAGSSVCISHKTAAQTAAAVQGAKFPGIYSRSLAGVHKEIVDEVVAQGEYEGLKSTDIEPELALARIELAQMLQAEDYSAKQRLNAIQTIAKVASIAKNLKELDNNAIRAEFVDAIIKAVTFAFHRANAISDPVERAQIFQQEFMAFFPEVEGTPQPFVDGEYTVTENSNGQGEAEVKDK